MKYSMQKLAMMLQFTIQKAQYNCLMYKKVRKKICGVLLLRGTVNSKLKIFQNGSKCHF